MAQTESSKVSGKKSGHAAHKETRKKKCQMYLSRATCIACRLVFRSPKKRRLHDASGHKSLLGVNTKRQVKTSLV